ncbi:MAG: hypothetical protein ACKO7R_06400 [Pseudanabaena sp.]
MAGQYLNDAIQPKKLQYLRNVAINSGDKNIRFCLIIPCWISAIADKSNMGLCGAIPRTRSTRNFANFLE